GTSHMPPAFCRGDLDDVAVAQEADRPADRRLRPDVADAEAAGRAGEAPVGDERDLAVGALAIKGSRGREHFPHAGAAARSLVADHEHVALAVLAGGGPGAARPLPRAAARPARGTESLHSRPPSPSSPPPRVGPSRAP